MKIIDFERKGNVVRFYLGDNDCTDYWGDDWNDTPYECNAGTVYGQYVKAVKDISFDFDSLVLEPCSGEYNSGYCKEDMKNGICPCIIVVPKELAENTWNDRFAFWCSAKDITKFYFNDEMEA